MTAPDPDLAAVRAYLEPIQRTPEQEEESLKRLRILGSLEDAQAMNREGL